MTQNTRIDSPEALPSIPGLNDLVDGVRDAALGVSGFDLDHPWETIKVKWPSNQATATLRRIGNEGVELVLDAKTHSSNGVNSQETYTVVSAGEGGSAHERWLASWRHPVPGSSFGKREGVEAIEQMSVTLGRFLKPIVARNVSVKIN